MNPSTSKRALQDALPVLLTLGLLLLLVISVVLQSGGDPLSLASLGTLYSEGNPEGTQGYDGQFVYYIARDPSPASVSRYLDTPAYRYQRILLPLLARGLSFGNLNALPWVLAGLGILTHTIGTWIVAELLAMWGVKRTYALVYGLWVGFLLAVRLDLPEPLAYGLVAAAILAHEKRKNWLSWVLWGLALFAKEVSALFVAAALLSDLIHRRWSGAFGLLLVAVLPYGLFQYWLLLNFGALGISSGGAMATPFELIPLMGFVRIGFYSWLYFLAMLLVFGPAVILPAIWSLWAGFRKIVSGESNLLVLSLLLNALVILFLPFSTFRETGGLLRYAGGLVLSLLLFASRNRMIKVLNYSQLWLVLNVFLLKS